MEEFKLGDTVRLKSGGPLMTIEGVGQYGFGETENTVKCVWFESNKGQQSKKEDTFLPALLTKG